jgi:hypothetical protein
MKIVSIVVHAKTWLVSGEILLSQTQGCCDKDDTCHQEKRQQARESNIESFDDELTTRT